MPTRNYSPEVMARYTTDTVPPYHCNVAEGHCGKEYTNPGSLITHANRLHLRTIDPNGGGKRRKKKFHCPQEGCDRVLRSKGGLSRHLRETHHVSGANGTNGSNGNGNGHGGRQLTLARRINRPMEIEFGKTVIYCPCCGTNIPIIQKAIDMASAGLLK